MSQAKKVRKQLQQVGKQNSFNYSPPTSTTLNFKFNRHFSTLINKNVSMNDDRIKELKKHEEQLQQMLSKETEKHKQEINVMFRKNLSLETIVSNMSKIKQQNQQEINTIKEKLKNAIEKTIQQQSVIREQIRQMEKMNEKIQKLQKESEIECEIKCIKLKQEISKLVHINDQRCKREQQIQQKWKTLQDKNTELQQQLQRNREEWSAEVNGLQTQIKYHEQNYLAIRASYEQEIQKINTLFQTKIEQSVIKENQLSVLEQKYATLDMNMKTLLNKKNQQSQHTINILKREILNYKRSISQLQQNETKHQQQYKQISEEKDAIDIEFHLYKSETKKMKEVEHDLEKILKSYQMVIEKLRKNEVQLQTELALSKVRNEEILEQLENNRGEYQKALSIESSKCNQFQQLVKCLREKLSYQLSECVQREKEVQLIYQEQKQLKNNYAKENEKLKCLITTIQIQLIQYKTQVQNLRETLKEVQQQQERVRLRMVESQKIVRESEMKKWKQYSNDLNKQLEEDRKENEKNKGVIEQKQEIIVEMKQKINQLSNNCSKYLREKETLIQKHQQQIIALIKKYENKMQQLSEESHSFEQKTKIKIRNDLHAQSNLQLAKALRKLQEKNITILNYEEKIQNLQQLLQQCSKSSMIEIEKWKKEVEHIRQPKNKMGEMAQSVRLSTKKPENDDKIQMSYRVPLPLTQKKNTNNCYEVQLITAKLRKLQVQKLQWEERQSNTETKGFIIQSQKIELETQIKRLRHEKLQIEDQQAELKENYEIIYNKYIKYKEAFKSYKDKLMKKEQSVIDDQKYTEEILNHCMTLFPTIDW